MTNIEALHRLKALIEDCASEEPKRDMNDVCVDLVTNAEYYIRALDIALSTVSP